MYYSQVFSNVNLTAFKYKMAEKLEIAFKVSSVCKHFLVQSQQLKYFNKRATTTTCMKLMYTYEICR